MKLPVLTATHKGDGVWEFICPLHDPELKTGQISSPRHATSVLETHLDKQHPGTKARIKVMSDYSGNKTSVYTAPSNVSPGDRL